MENPLDKWKRFINKSETDEGTKKRDNGNKFRKFDYEEDDDFDLEDFFSEFHGNTFNFHGFPPNVMRQFHEILAAMKEFEVDPENDENQRFFENKYNDFRQKSDVDLDGKIYADQLDTLLKGISPNHLPKNDRFTPPPKQKLKQSDEDKIMDKIHGTFRQEVVPVKPNKSKLQKVPVHPHPHHFGGIPPFEFSPPRSQNPQSSHSQSWGKTIISIRKPDGSYETRQVERGQDGQTKTTITRKDADGKSSTQTFLGDGSQLPIDENSIKNPGTDEYAERNLVTKNGYKIPCLF